MFSAIVSKLFTIGPLYDIIFSIINNERQLYNYNKLPYSERMVGVMSIQYINPDDVITEYTDKNPEYKGKKLSVKIYDHSYSIKNGRVLLETVQPSDVKTIFKEAGKIYGYCRISRPQQSIDRQIRNIKKDYPDATIFQEAYTGTKMDRPIWDKLYAMVKSGDMIVFDSVSRMSRTSDDGIKTYMDLYDRGVRLVFLKEHYIDTDTYKENLQDKIELTGTDEDEIFKGLNNYFRKLAVRQIKIAFDQAEKEVQDLRQRTREGIETARLKGKQIGQKPEAKLHVKKKAPAMEKIKLYSRDFDGTLKDGDVIKLTGLARNTYYKYKKELSQ